MAEVQEPTKEAIKQKKKREKEEKLAKAKADAAAKKGAELEAALERLQPEETLPPASAPSTKIRHAPQDPRSFLQAVMNDASVPLALRIEAAKALLIDPQSR